MKLVVACLAMAWAAGLTSGGEFFSTESEEVDSSEAGVVKGAKGTSCKCGWANKPDKRIVGGREAHTNEYPFLVSIALNERKNQFCGGAIISPYHIITAFHCFYDYTDEMMKERLLIIAGEHDIKSRTHRKLTQLYNVVKWTPHPDFHKTPGFGPKNDLVIVQVDREIVFSQRIGPVCLPNGPIDLTNQYVRDMGWGLTTDGGADSPVVRKVDERVAKKSHCLKHYPRVTPEEKILCTFGTGKASCKGDSGGPIVWVDPETNMYTLVGVVSYGRECGGSEPSVNVDVTQHVQWIKQTIQDMKPAPTCTKN